MDLYWVVRNYGSMSFDVAGARVWSVATWEEKHLFLDGETSGKNGDVNWQNRVLCAPRFLAKWPAKRHVLHHFLCLFPDKQKIHRFKHLVLIVAYVFFLTNKKDTLHRKLNYFLLPMFFVSTSLHARLINLVASEADLFIVHFPRTKSFWFISWSVHVR